MPFAKCRCYDLDGTPIDGGCRRGDANCEFVHPSHPDWAKARDPKKDLASKASGSRSRSGGGASSSAGWGAPPSSTASGWNASSSGWGEAGSSWTEAPKADTGKSAGWGDASQAKSNESNGWTSTSAGSGWGDPPAEDSTKGGGWWADPAKSTEPSGWGSSSGAWGASETPTNASEPEGGVNADGMAPSDGQDKRRVSGDGSGWGEPSKDPQGQGQSGNEFKPTPAGNVTPRRQSDDIEMQDVPPLSATSHRSSFSMGLPGSPTGTDTTTDTRVRPSKRKAKAVGPTERRYAWEGTVKAVAHAVRAHEALVSAEKQRDRYKQVQTSGIFARVSTAGREKLDNDRLNLEEIVVKRTNDFKRHLESLERLPEMSSNFLDFSSKVDEVQIPKYVDEMKDWIETVRPLLVKLEAVAKSRVPDSSTSMISVEDGQIDNQPSPLKRRHTSPEPDSPAGILARLSRAEDRLEEMHSDLHLRVQTTKANQMVHDTVDMVRAAKIDDSTSSDPVLRLSSRADELGNTVAREAEKTAAVLTRQGEMNRELAALREENQKLLQNEAQREQLDVDMRKEIDEHAAHLRRMQEQMQQLLAQRLAPPPFHLSEASFAKVSSIARDTVNEEVDPAIIDFKFAIQGQISDQHTQIYQTLWQRLEPSLQLTERIYQWIESQIQKQAA